MLDNKRGNWTLISMLVTVAIIIVVAAMYFHGGVPSPTSVKQGDPLLDASGGKVTVMGQALDAARGTNCRNQLSQIRQSVSAWKSSTGSEQNPETMAELGLGVGADYFKCPVTGEPYAYDPATGTVRCVNPGHANY
jgi:hypothetical protein